MSENITLKLVMTSAVVLLSSLSSTAFAGSKSIPEPPSWSFPEVVESARAINPKNREGRVFNRFGLAYSQDELKRLQVPKMSPNELQNYADIVTHAYPDAIAKQLPTSCKEIPLDNLNETSIAGIAYVSLNAVESEARLRAKSCLSDIQSRMK